MEVRVDKQSIWISLDIGLLFFHIVSRHVWALVVTYNEISQAVAVKEDVLLPKPFQRFRNGFWTSAWTMSSDGNHWPWRCFFGFPNT
jgi:hypothetical protein